MEPVKKIKKFNSFTQKKEPRIFNMYPRQEPRLTYRYLMEFPLGDRMYIWWVNCELPSVRHNLIRRDGWGIMEPTMGRVGWEPIQVRFIDMVFGYEDSDINEFYGRLQTKLNNFNKINTTIKRLDPTGIEVDVWHLRGCLITNIIHEYIMDDQPNVEITLQYDYCRLN